MKYYDESWIPTKENKERWIKSLKKLSAAGAFRNYDAEIMANKVLKNSRIVRRIRALRSKDEVESEG